MKTFSFLLAGLVLSSTLTLTPAKADDNAIIPMVQGKLVHLQNGELAPVDASTLADKKYFAIYYSASWCPPCHAFTPHLVDFYNSFKPSHPDFALIFVSDDQSADAMKGYMTEMSMPWLAVNWDALQGSGKGSGIQSFANSGIPDLVLVDSTGKVLSDSFAGDTYLGPQKVVDDIQTMVK